MSAKCEHPYISWHGSRGECQTCGNIVMAPDTNAILEKLFNQWRDDILSRTECTVKVRHKATECNGQHDDLDRWEWSP